MPNFVKIRQFIVDNRSQTDRSFIVSISVEIIIIINKMARNTFVPRYTGSIAVYCLKIDFQVYQTLTL